MTARWRKLGRLYAPEGGGRHPKLASHAANPLPVQLDDDVYRIFYSGRDAANKSSVGAVDIDLSRRSVVMDHHEPFFEYGAAGEFYESGVSVGNCYEADGRRYMLFMGWETPPGEHWRGSVGRLVVRPDLTLQLDSSGPFMPIGDIDPISLSYPWVRCNESGSFDMWYGSTVSWDVGNSEMLHVIKYASSTDGLNWHREGQVVPHKLGDAQAFSRPTIARNVAGGWDMWFSYRGGPETKYRIGYAFSENGQTWTLAVDAAGIDVSIGGWDSEMIEYPFVFDHKGCRYMLYNGNDYGRTGFGLAVLE
jgi:hypothetical protein